MYSCTDARPACRINGLFLHVLSLVVFSFSGAIVSAQPTLGYTTAETQLIEPLRTTFAMFTTTDNEITCINGSSTLIGAHRFCFDREHELVPAHIPPAELVFLGVVEIEPELMLLFYASTLALQFEEAQGLCSRGRWRCISNDSLQMSAAIEIADQMNTSLALGLSWSPPERYSNVGRMSGTAAPMTLRSRALQATAPYLFGPVVAVGRRYIDDGGRWLSTWGDNALRAVKKVPKKVILDLSLEYAKKRKKELEELWVALWTRANTATMRILEKRYSQSELNGLTAQQREDLIEAGMDEFINSDSGKAVQKMLDDIDKLKNQFDDFIESLS